MKQQIIRITENDLHRLIEKTVQEYIHECDCGGALGGATNANISADAQYVAPIAPTQRRKFYSDALKKNKNGSVSIED